MVVAAGNDGRDNSENTNGYMTITAPGNDPYVITVGAMKTEGTPTRTDDLVASYSSKGPTAIDHIVKPDLVAPGNNVVSLAAPNSTLASLYPGNQTLLDYYESGLQGTAGYFAFIGLLHTKRNQHGDAGGKRRRGIAAAGTSLAHAGSDKSAADEDRLQVVSDFKCSGGSDNGYFVHQLLRHFHGRARVTWI